MWPLSVPSFNNPFGDVACPGGAKCAIPYCIFSHAALKPPVPLSSKQEKVSAFQGGREAKRLKLEDATAAPVFVGSFAPKSSPSANKDISETGNTVATSKTSNGRSSLPRTAIRPISPPPKASASKPTAKPDPEVPLRPAKLQKEPAIYTKRVLFIQQLRKSMVPLNEQVKKDADASVKCLVLSENQLNKLAIDEESKTAVSHKTVYENVLKQRLVALKKMGLAAWVKERKEAMALESPVKSTKEPPKPVDTGLSPHEEITFLSQLTFPQKGLDAHGYITHLPTDAELQNTLQALASADYWEVCDRCNTRFQVFPDRREEDGALTTGGKCQHHWGKKIFPRKAKNTMPGPTRYTCCNEPLGSPGCSTYDTHVFKVSDPKRLSTIMPFIETPENEEVDPHSAVCFDCEMGYTTSGLELLRLTAVSWPSHKPILDILVRPLGHILDVNTRFSGISTDQYFNAKPHDPANPIFNPTDLRIVDSPYLARDQFLKHVSPSTPLIGHALENDLNSIRLIHPLFIDTVFLYPHPAGLPIRNSLKNLAKRHLDWDIQQGGAAGHDSFEDARATGELVRFKVAQRWKMLKIDGWTIGEEGVCPPVPAGEPPPLPEVPPPSEPSTGEKRKFEQDEGIDGGEEQEPVTKKRTDASRMSF